MNPFAIELRILRAKRELSQGEFATLVGQRQNTISALERGTKPPKDPVLVRTIVEVLRLGPGEESTLWMAFNASQRDITPSANAPAAAFYLYSFLGDAIALWSPTQIEAALELLKEFHKRHGQAADVDRQARSLAKEVPV